MKQINKNMIAVFVTGVFIFLFGCNYNIQKQKQQGGSETVFTTGAELSYATVREQVLVTACLTCHSNNGSRGINKDGVNLETYATFMDHKNEVWDSILSGDMPKDSPPLSEYQKRLILSWLESGANEFAKSPAPPGTPPVLTDPPITPPIKPPPGAEPPVDPTLPAPVNPPATKPAPVVVPEIPEDEIDYEVVKKYVLSTNCTTCHKAGSKRDLSTYEKVFAKRFEISDQLNTMQMPPSRGIPLTPDQLKLIFTWLDKDAPEKAEKKPSPTK